MINRITLSKTVRTQVPADNVILKIKIKHLAVYRFVTELTKGKLSEAVEVTVPYGVCGLYRIAGIVNALISLLPANRP